jgi:hypothetical protein
MSNAAQSDDEQRTKPRLQEMEHAGVTSGAAASGGLRFSKWQIALAIVIAAASDALCAFVVIAPPVVWGIDVLTAVLLFAVLGWHWLLLPGLVMEAIPGLGVIPFWLLVVGAILVWGTARPKLK